MNVGDVVEYPAHWDTPAAGKQRVIARIIAIYGLEVIAEIISPEHRRGGTITDHFKNFLIWEQMTF